MQWDYTNEAGSDAHYSLLRGTRASLTNPAGERRKTLNRYYIFCRRAMIRLMSNCLQNILLASVKKYRGLRWKNRKKAGKWWCRRNWPKVMKRISQRVMQNYLGYLKMEYAGLGSAQYAGEIFYHLPGIGTFAERKMNRVHPHYAACLWPVSFGHIMVYD